MQAAGCHSLLVFLSFLFSVQRKQQLEKPTLVLEMPAKGITHTHNQPTKGCLSTLSSASWTTCHRPALQRESRASAAGGRPFAWT